MNYGDVLFNPQGRISPAAFQRAALILIGIGFVLNILPAISLALGMLSTLGLLLIYPWVVIWVKRLHDAGQSGWLFLAVLVAWFIVGWIVSMIVFTLFAGNAAVSASGAQDFSAMMQQMSSASRATAVPNAIAGALIAFGFVWGANMLLKSQPEANQYGPPPGPDGTSKPDAEGPA